MFEGNVWGVIFWVLVGFVSLSLAVDSYQLQAKLIKCEIQKND